MTNQENINQEEEIDLIDLIKSLWAKKLWFIISGAICLVFAIFYILVTTPTYNVEAKVTVVDDAGGSITTGLMGDMGMLSMMGMGGGSAQTDEIEMLSSKNLLRKVVNKLELYQSVYQNGLLRDEQLYGAASPLKVVISEPLNLIDTTFTIKPLSSIELEITNAADSTFTYRVGTPLNIIEGVTVTIEPNELIDSEQEYTLNLHNIEKLVKGISGNNLTIAQVDKTSSIGINYITPVIQLGYDVIYTLIDEHNTTKVNYDRSISLRTDNFIKQRLELIEQELSIAEDKVEAFKSENNITAIDTEAEMMAESIKSIQEMSFNIETQLRMMDFIKNSLNDNGDYEIIPENLGISSEGVNSGIVSYNNLVLERDRTILNSGASNPLVKTLERQIVMLSQSIKKGIENAESTLKIQLEQVKLEEDGFMKRASSSPLLERSYRDIARHQALTERTYIFLLQKREETQIAMIAMTGNIRIIDDPIAYEDEPAAPSKMMVLLAAAMLAFILPAGYIIFKYLMDDKLRSAEDLNGSDLPIIGSIPLEAATKSKGGESSFNNNAKFESFSLARESLKHLFQSEQKGGSSVILVSSSLSEEGKSYCAANLAYNYAALGKRVLLIGTDMRKPAIGEIFNKLSTKGLSDYLSSTTATLEECTEPSGVSENLKIMTEGGAATNATILLNSPRLEALISDAKQSYEVIILDGAPTMIVSDSLIIAKHSDSVVYLATIGVTPKSTINNIEKYAADGRMKNLAILLNMTEGVADSLSGYGQHSVESKRRWFKLG